jgi:hypothetical protein
VACGRSSVCPWTLLIFSRLPHFPIGTGRDCSSSIEDAHPDRSRFAA